jgi:hypothetical protein
VRGVSVHGINKVPGSARGVGALVTHLNLLLLLLLPMQLPPSPPPPPPSPPPLLLLGKPSYTYHAWRAEEDLPSSYNI